MDQNLTAAAMQQGAGINNPRTEEVPFPPIENGGRRADKKIAFEQGKLPEKIAPPLSMELDRRGGAAQDCLDPDLRPGLHQQKG